MRAGPRSPYPKAVYRKNARSYKLMAHPVRLEILNILHRSPATAGQLADVVGTTKTNMSQHLAILKRMKLVRSERVGRNIIYTIVNPRIVELCAILQEIEAEQDASALTPITTA